MAKRSWNADIDKEGTGEFERTHIDAIALNHVFDIVERLRRGNGFVGPQDDWYDKACPSPYRIQFSYNPSQGNADKSALEGAVQTRNVLRPAADALYKIWAHVSRQLEICEGNIKSYNLRRGFCILPDEILSTVLEYAALQGPRKEDERNNEEENIVSTVKSAVKLSHTCKRFRYLIIHSPKLWKCIFVGMGKLDMVSTCLSRCARAGEITLSTSLFETSSSPYRQSACDNTSFILTVLKRTENWGSFILQGGSEYFIVRSEEYPYNMMFREFREGRLQDYIALAKDLNLPNLTQLTIRYPDPAVSLKVLNDANFRNAIHLYSRWSTPRLRSIFAKNFIPIPFSGARSLTSLHVVLQFVYDNDNGDSDLDVKSFASFLSACPGLEKFTLAVHCVKHASTSQEQPEQRIEMPRVTDLNLEFDSCYGAPLKMFFTAVHFPQVTTLGLHIVSQEGEHEHGMRYGDIFSAVLPNSEEFPKLTDVTLHVQTVGYIIRRDVGIVRAKIVIPFSKMPNLRDLVFTTLESEVDLIPLGIALPNIRTLALRDCWRIQKCWLALFLKQMEAQGDLDLLRVSIDGRCHLLNECGLKGPLSKEDIQLLVVK